MKDAQVAREKLVSDFNTVITDSEDLVKAMASAGGEKATALRGDLERKLKSARERLVEMERKAVDRTREVVKETDHYVHDHPWQAIAVGAAVAGVIGIALGLMLNRR